MNPACSVLRYTPQLSAAKMVQMHQSGTFRVLPIADELFKASLHYLPSHCSAVTGRPPMGSTADHMTCSMLPCQALYGRSAHTNSGIVLLHRCKRDKAAAQRLSQVHSTLHGPLLRVRVSLMTSPLNPVVSANHSVLDTECQI